VIAIGFTFAGLAAVIHVYIFFLESIVWTSQRARKIFGIATLEEATAMKMLAFNQGFYNLFLAVEVLLGIVLFFRGEGPVGATLVFVGTGSMIAASLVLALSSADKRPAALKQGLAPLLGAITLAIGLA
jgi:putative membrane protein